MEPQQHVAGPQNSQKRLKCAEGGPATPPEREVAESPDETETTRASISEERSPTSINHGLEIKKRGTEGVTDTKPGDTDTVGSPVVWTGEGVIPTHGRDNSASRTFLRL
jgi:hypothetical protein